MHEDAAQGKECRLNAETIACRLSGLTTQAKDGPRAQTCIIEAPRKRRRGRRHGARRHRLGKHFAASSQLEHPWKTHTARLVGQPPHSRTPRTMGNEANRRNGPMGPCRNISRSSSNNSPRKPARATSTRSSTKITQAVWGVISMVANAMRMEHHSTASAGTPHAKHTGLTHSQRPPQQY